MERSTLEVIREVLEMIQKRKRLLRSLGIENEEAYKRLQRLEKSTEALLAYLTRLFE